MKQNGYTWNEGMVPLLMALLAAVRSDFLWMDACESPDTEKSGKLRVILQCQDIRMIVCLFFKFTSATWSCILYIYFSQGSKNNNKKNFA